MAAGPTPHFQMLGHYNAWANARLFDAAARLDEAHWFNHQTHHRGQAHAF